MPKPDPAQDAAKRIAEFAAKLKSPVDFIGEVQRAKYERHA